MTMRVEMGGGMPEPGPPGPRSGRPRRSASAGEGEVVSAIVPETETGEIVDRVLAPLHLSPELAGTARIVLTEALNNVAEHAYGGAAPGRVEVDCRTTEAHLVIRLSDEGRAMPDLSLPEGQPADLSGEGAALPEGGFGWFLIRQLTDTQVYDRADGRNHLLLEIPLRPARG